MGRCVHEADEKWGGESKGADEKWGGESVTPCMHPIESGIMCMLLDKLVNTDHIFQLANVLSYDILL